MRNSIYNVGDFVRVVEVGDTLPISLIGQIFTVTTKNWNILVLRPHDKNEKFTLHLDDSCVQMWKSKKIQHLEARMRAFGLEQPLTLKRPNFL